MLSLQSSCRKYIYLAFKISKKLYTSDKKIQKKLPSVFSFYSDDFLYEVHFLCLVDYLF